MTGYAICPYCDKETQVEFEEHNQLEEVSEQCEHCERWFKYWWEPDVIINCEKDEEEFANSEEQE